MSTFLADLRFAVRVLFRSPGFTAVAVLVLALGIGANTAVFSVINAVLLKPLPYPQPERLVSVYEGTPTIPNAATSMPNYLDYRASQKGFTDLALTRRGAFDVSYGPLGGGAPPERIRGILVSANYLPVLNVAPALGRNFSETEDTPGGPKSVVISDSLWRRRFASNPAVVGQSLVLDGVPHEIIGVLPASVDFTRSPEVFKPFGDMRKTEDFLNRDSHPGLYMTGRLKDGVTLAQAKADLDGIAAEMARRYPESNTNWKVVAKPLLEASVGSYRRSLYLLFGAVACVLLIACANVANLQLARAAGRSRELAVRAALGASRWRLVRQLLTESTLLGILGGGAGILLAAWGTAAIVALTPETMSRFKEARLDPGTLAVSALVAVLTGLLAGVWPAWRLSGAKAMSKALHENGARGASGGAGQQRARASLIVAQVALAVVLLAGAGLTLRAFGRMQNEPLGFRSDGVLTLAISLPDANYPETQTDKLNAFHTRLLDQVRTLPGVSSAALSFITPFSGSNWTAGFHVVGTPPDKPGEGPEVAFDKVSPGYFEVMGMPILRGRDFNAGDRPGQPKAMVIDDIVAKQFFPGRDPVGEHIDDPMANGKTVPPVVIVGVVPHVRREVPGENVELASLGEVYLCTAQNHSESVRIMARVDGGDPLRLVEPIRQIMHGLDPEVPMADVVTMNGSVAASLAPQRLTMVLLGVFAAVALGLATVGLYGVMALSVTQRTRELGIRLALGAQRSTVLALVLRQGASLVGIGLAVGLAIALVAGRVLSQAFYGVGGSDLLTLGAVCVVLAGAALLACWLPARRATRLDPMVALRDE